MKAEVVSGPEPNWAPGTEVNFDWRVTITTRRDEGPRTPLLPRWGCRGFNLARSMNVLGSRRILVLRKLNWTSFSYLKQFQLIQEASSE